MSLNSEVVWSNANVPDDKIVNRGMGIRFIHNTDEVRESLKTALSGKFLIGDLLPQATLALRPV